MGPTSGKFGYWALGVTVYICNLGPWEADTGGQGI